MLCISPVDSLVSCLSGLPWAANMFWIVCAAHDIWAGFHFGERWSLGRKMYYVDGPTATVAQRQIHCGGGIIFAILRLAEVVATTSTATLSGSWLPAARADPSASLCLLQVLPARARALNEAKKKKKKEAAVWNERRAQMRWAQTERKCCWKGKRWEEEKHRRLLISSLVLFLCYVCFMFPSADWRDYRLRRSYVQVPLMWPSSIYFIGDSFLSLFSSQEKRRWSGFAALSQTLLHKWLQHITPSFHQSNSLCSVLLGAGLLQSSFFFFPLQFPLKSSHEKLIGSHYY